ncbi:TPA: hypothetical protein ACLNKT_002544, partial [Vibrio cholerae O1]
FLHTIPFLHHNFVLRVTRTLPERCQKIVNCRLAKQNICPLFPPLPCRVSKHIGREINQAA